MSRHRFRSQPALQRSGGRYPPLAGLALLAFIGVGSGAILNQLARQPVSPPVSIQHLGVLDEPAVSAAPSPSPPTPEAAPATPVAAPASLAPVVKTTSLAPAKRSRPARHAALAQPQPQAPQQTWEQQRDDYERARATYDDHERAAGFRWAQENKIKVARYCRVAAQRTPAFAEGCTSYVTSLRAGRSGQPREPANPQAAEQG
jgi:hypothetical protein